MNNANALLTPQCGLSLGNYFTSMIVDLEDIDSRCKHNIMDTWPPKTSF